MGLLPRSEEGRLSDKIGKKGQLLGVALFFASRGDLANPHTNARMKNIKGLRADLRMGEGEFRFPSELRDESLLMQADILQDWVAALQSEYQRVLQDWAVQMAKVPLEVHLANVAAENQKLLDQSQLCMASLEGRRINKISRDAEGNLVLDIVGGPAIVLFSKETEEGSQVIAATTE